MFSIMRHHPRNATQESADAGKDHYPINNAGRSYNSGSSPTEADRGTSTPAADLHFRRLRRGVKRFHDCCSSESRTRYDRGVAECRAVLRRYLLLDIPPSRFAASSSAGSNKVEAEEQVADGNDRYVVQDAIDHANRRKRFRPLGLWAMSLHYFFADPEVQVQLRELSLTAELWIVFSGLLGFIAYGFLTYDADEHYRNAGFGVAGADGGNQTESSSAWLDEPLISAQRGRWLGKVCAVVTCHHTNNLRAQGINSCSSCNMMTSHLATLGMSIGETDGGTRAAGGSNTTISRVGSAKQHINADEAGDVAEINSSSVPRSDPASTLSWTRSARALISIHDVSSRTVALVRILKATGANVTLTVHGTNFLALSILLYCLTLLPVVYGIIGAASTVVFWFTPDYLISMYAGSVGDAFSHVDEDRRLAVVRLRNAAQQLSQPAGRRLGDRGPSREPGIAGGAYSEAGAGTGFR
ncbi:unnamed protein product [Amoebophrya sp. A120]|nr:unnamed protein product [Amoebophrya sp. A120]|eukprot:GSA120T00006607001.1